MKTAPFPKSLPAAEQGFVLVLTLWVLVIVALAAGFFADRVVRAVDLAQQSRQNTRAAIGMAAARAEILYRLGTTSLTEYGLGRGDSAIALDNRPYRSAGNVLLRLQDNRGLFNLNVSEDDRLYRFLGIVGIPAGQRGHMIATLRDYVDSGKLHRLNGAGDDEYRALGLPLPAHRNLITPWEANRIIGWRDVPELWQTGRLVAVTTTSTSFGINPNTAPAEILATLPGFTEEIAQATINRRKLAPIVQVQDLAALTGIPAGLLADEISVIPSNSLRISQSGPESPWAVQYTITLTPMSSNGPWRTDYYTRVQVNTSADLTSKISELPKHSVAPPELNPN